MAQQQPQVCLGGAVLATLVCLAKQGSITHKQLAAATGRNKGNGLRVLYAHGFAQKAVVAGQRGYTNSITPQGQQYLASLGKVQPVGLHGQALKLGKAKGSKGKGKGSK